MTDYIPTVESYLESRVLGNAAKAASVLAVRERFQLVSDFFTFVGQGPKVKGSPYSSLYVTLILAAYAVPANQVDWEARMKDFAPLVNTPEGKRKLAGASAVAFFCGLDISKVDDSLSSAMPFNKYHASFKDYCGKQAETTNIPCEFHFADFQWKAFGETIPAMWQDYHESMIKKLAERHPEAKQFVSCLFKKGFWLTINLNKVQNHVGVIQADLDEFLRALDVECRSEGYVPRIGRDVNGKIRTFENNESLPKVRGFEDKSFACINPMHFKFTREAQARVSNKRYAREQSESWYVKFLEWSNLESFRNMESSQHLQTVFAEPEKKDPTKEDTRRFAAAVQNFCSDIQLLTARSRFGAFTAEVRDKTFAQKANANDNMAYARNAMIAYKNGGTKPPTAPPVPPPRPTDFIPGLQTRRSDWKDFTLNALQKALVDLFNVDPEYFKTDNWKKMAAGYDADRISIGDIVAKPIQKGKFSIKAWN